MLLARLLAKRRRRSRGPATASRDRGRPWSVSPHRSRRPSGASAAAVPVLARPPVRRRGRVGARLRATGFGRLRRFGPGGRRPRRPGRTRGGRRPLHRRRFDRGHRLGRRRNHACRRRRHVERHDGRSGNRLGPRAPGGGHQAHDGGGEGSTGSGAVRAGWCVSTFPLLIVMRGATACGTTRRGPEWTRLQSCRRAAAPCDTPWTAPGRCPARGS